jgi:hypothetical protein
MFFKISDRTFKTIGFPMVSEKISEHEFTNEPYERCSICRNFTKKQILEFHNVEGVLEKRMGTKWGDVLYITDWYSNCLFSEKAIKVIFNCDYIPEYCHKYKIANDPPTKKLNMDLMPDYYWIDEILIESVKLDYEKSGLPVKEYCDKCGGPIYVDEDILDFLEKENPVYYVDEESHNGEEFFPFVSDASGFVGTLSLVKRIVENNLSNFHIVPFHLYYLEEYRHYKGIPYWKKGFNLDKYLKKMGWDE